MPKLYDQIEQIVDITAAANTILIIQADNPDADSLGSALALEAIFSDLGKNVNMYCGVDIPGYLQYIAGWDRVRNDIPNNFDASFIVDASTMTLLEKLSSSGSLGWVSSKPVVVLDHHAVVDNPITFANVEIVDDARSSAGELIYQVAKQAGWPVPLDALSPIMTAILGDTQGLSNQLTSADTYRVMAELTEGGVDRPALEDLRRESTKMPKVILSYKGQLLQRTKFTSDGAVAYTTIPQSEISTFSPLYNPGPLVLGDLLQTEGVKMAIIIKYYDDGKVTGAIRCNPGAPFAAELAATLGGGGHPYASGFKVTDGRTLDEIVTECLTTASQLLTQ